jgi:hypothetical protein
MSMFKGFKGFSGFKPPDMANIRARFSSNMSLKKVGDKLLPLDAGITNVLEKIAQVNNITSAVFTQLPAIFTVIDIIALLILPILIFMVSIRPTRGFGKAFANKIYSIFYLIRSIVIFLLLFFYANPVLDTVSKTTNDGSTSQVDTVINELFSIYNNTINIALIPIMLIEATFLILVIFLITVMFVITTSLGRTYYAMHCKYGQEVKPLWWATLVDIIMHIVLIVFLILTVVFQLIENLPIGKILPSTLFLNVRRIFVIALVYYMLQLIFLFLDYIISNNILAISKWKEPNYNCESNDKQTSFQSAMNIFYLILNIIACFIIWVILLALVGGHIYVMIFFAMYISKGFKIINLASNAFLFLFSGNMTLSKVENKIKSVTETASSAIPGGIPGGIPDVIGMGKAQLEKELAKHPNFSVKEMLANIMGQTSMPSEYDEISNVLQRGPRNTNIPMGTPVQTDIPTGTPVQTDIPMAVPVQTDIPMAVPVQTDIPMAVPVQTDIPMAVPVQTDIPMAVPVQTTKDSVQDKLTSGLTNILNSKGSVQDKLAKGLEQTKAIAGNSGLSNILNSKGSVQDKLAKGLELGKSFAGNSGLGNIKSKESESKESESKAPTIKEEPPTVAPQDNTSNTPKPEPSSP